MSYQIRDARGFSLTFVEADDAKKALASFIADRAKGTALANAKVDADGVASVKYRGMTFYALPPEPSTD